MGLTIHYKLNTQDDEADALGKLQALHDLAKDMESDGLLIEVSPMMHWTKKKLLWHLDDKNKSKYRWAAIQASGPSVAIGEERGYKRYMTVVPTEGYIFTTWPDEGCEQANFGLFRFPQRVLAPLTEYEKLFTQRKHKSVRTNLHGWYWSSFCKTAYADHPVSAHLAVTALLDKAKELELVHEVHDEGEYWEKRDLSLLAAEYSADREMLMGLAEFLKQRDPHVEGYALELLSRYRPLEPAQEYED